MRSRLQIRIFLIIVIVLVFCLATQISLVRGSTLENLTEIEKQADQCLSDSKSFMADMQDNNFSVNRINESLRQAQNLFDSQKILKEGNSSYDFSLVIPYCEEIKIIKENAFGAEYEFDAFKKFYNESITPEMNKTSIEAIISEIEVEFNNERYEKVKPLVEKAYQETISVKSSYTALNAFYRATTKGLKKFLFDNWIYISSIIVLIIILFIIFRRPILKWQIERKILSLETRKKTLKELIMATQRDYFQNGNMAEGTYNIRTKKFAELVRDIDRQVPLLKEEYIKLERKIK